MTTVHGPRRFGEGPLSVVASLVYTLIVAEVQMLLASLPGLVGLLLLAQDLSNIPLVALCAVPFGPALSAAFYTLYHRRRDLTELSPFRQYWHGYRINWRAILPLWAIGLGWLAILGVTLANFWVAGLPVWWAVLLMVIALVTALWLTNALVIASLFSFRLRDVARLSWEMLGRTPVSTLGNSGVLVAALLLAFVTSEVLVVLLGVLFVLALVSTSRPTIDLVREEYTR